MFTYPGYENEGSFDYFINWCLTTGKVIYSLADTAWLLLNLISTTITTVAIFKILKIVKQLQNNKLKVTVNKRTMIAHCSLLML